MLFLYLAGLVVAIFIVTIGFLFIIVRAYYFFFWESEGCVTPWRNENTTYKKWFLSRLGIG